MSDSTGQIAKINYLENGKGLQYLLNESYKILGNPLVLFNMEYKLIACTQNIVTDDILWNEIVGTGIFSNETICFFRDENFLDTVASTKTISLLTSDKVKYDRLYGRIFNIDNSTVADLVLTACDKPFTDDVPMAFKAVCEKITNEISNCEVYQHYGIVYHETLIRGLLDLDFDDKIACSDHVANLYEGLKANIFVVVVDFSKCNTAIKKLEKFRDSFKRTQAELKYAVYSDYIVIIASTDDTELNINRDFNKLITFFQCKKMQIGISSRFENLFDLRKHYDEAVKALIPYQKLK